MSAAFIGCKISLISKSEIRYEGILYTIDTKESTIALAKVRSFGTEDRQTDKPVAPRNEVYEYIIFRASDIKDLIVDDPPAQTSQQSPALSDPAILQLQSSGPSTSGPSSSYANTAAASAASGGHGGSSRNTSATQLLDSGNVKVITTTSRSSTPKGKNSPVEQQQQRPQRQNRENQNQNRGSFNQRNNGQPQNVRQSYGQPQGGDRRTNAPRGGRGDGNYRDQRDNQSNQPQYGHQQPRSFNQSNRGGRDEQGGNNYVQRQPRGGGGGGYQNRDSNQGTRPFQPRNQGYGQQNQRGYGQNRQYAPRAPRTDVTKLEDYDFDKAQEEFEKLGLEDGDKPAAAENAVPAIEQDGGDDEPAYNKEKSFFDTISCEAIERAKGNTNRIDRGVERKKNGETFEGMNLYRYRGRGFGRGRGGGNYSNRGNSSSGGYQNRQNYSYGPNRRGSSSSFNRNNGSTSEQSASKPQEASA